MILARLARKTWKPRSVVCVAAGFLCCVQCLLPARLNCGGTDLPDTIKLMLAHPKVRDLHGAWHLARSLNILKKHLGERDSLLMSIQQRLPMIPQVGDSGSGEDFLYMHRHMIHMLKHELCQLGIKNDIADGWDTIPWCHEDSAWPMPECFTTRSGDEDLGEALKENKSEPKTKEMQKEFGTDVWLREIKSIDELGRKLEGGIHVWMHNHWAAQEGYGAWRGQDPNSVKNDFLGSFMSAQVNKVFWKLHGWIDNQIAKWEGIHNREAEFNQAWNRLELFGWPVHEMSLTYLIGPGKDYTSLLTGELREIAEVGYLILAVPQK